MSENAPLENASGTVKPMAFWKALLYFGLPALLFRVCLYDALPLMIQTGLQPFQASVLSFTVPAAILFALAFGFYKRDGYPLDWGHIKTRFRLMPMTGKDCLWAIGGLVVTFLSIGALAGTAQTLINAFPSMAPPDFFPPWLKPGVNFDTALFANYIGAPVKGNWGVAVLFIVMLFFNIAGEELWWRGYVLPRQERVHGRWTWLLHGFLWLLWHAAFYPWQLLTLLPICLALPYIAQRRQNTWVALVIHLQNAVVLILVLAMVFGVV